MKSALRGWVWGLIAMAAASCGDDGDTQTAVFVDASAADGGDGSESEPFRTVGEALTSVPSGGLIYVAEGTYPVPDTWAFDADVEILGALSGQTVFVAEGGERIQWSGDGGVLLSMRDVHLGSAFEMAVANLALRDASITGEGPALSLDGNTATLQDTAISVTGEGGLGEFDDDAVLVRGAELTWTGGSAVDAPDRGLVAIGSEVALEGLALASGARAAIHLTESSTLVATESSIADAALAAFVQNSSLHLLRTSVARTAQLSILGGEGSVIRLEDSTFEDSPAGFVASSQRATSVDIIGSRFERASSDNCITASAGSLRVQDSYISGCAGSGISAITVDAEIVGNEIRDIEFDLIVGIVASAISLTEASATVTGNRITATLDSGIACIKSVVTASENEITAIGGAGISHVDGPEEVSTFSENTIDAATGAGIIVLTSSANLEGNRIENTALDSSLGFGDGIVFGSGANVYAEANEVSQSARSGFLFFNGAQGEIRGNTASGNGQYGVSELCVEEPNSVTTEGNTLTGNGAGELQLCSS